MGKHSKKRRGYSRSRSRPKTQSMSSSSTLCVQSQSQPLLFQGMSNVMPSHMMAQGHPYFMPGPMMFQQHPGLTGLCVGQPHPAPQPEAKTTAEDSSSTSSSESTTGSVERRIKQRCNYNMKATITSSATFLLSVPKSRRAQLLESLSSRFDAAVTADMSSDDINKLIWLLTKLKPLTKLSDLRVKRYSDLVTLMKQAMQRVGDQRGSDVLVGLTPDLTNVDEVARQHGWQDDFGKSPKKGRHAAQHGDEEQQQQQQQLPTMWQPPQQQRRPQPREDSDPEHRQEREPPGGGIARASRPGPWLALMPPPTPLRTSGAEGALAAAPRITELQLLQAPCGGTAPAPVGSPVRPARPQPKAESLRARRPAAGREPEREPPTCPICMQELIDEQEALLCGHVMHSECVQRMCEMNQCPKTEACPYRCHCSPSVAAAAHAQPLQEEVAEQTGALPAEDGAQPLAGPVPATDDGQEDREEAPVRQHSPDYVSSDVESSIDAALAQAEEDLQRSRQGSAVQ